jgi:GLPGLI family protein
MILNKALVAFVFLYTSISLAQEENITVEYKSIVHDNKDDYGSFDYEKTKLLTNRVESLYFETPLDTIVDIGNSDTYSNEDVNYSRTYYKNLKEKYVIYDKNYGIKSIIKDENYAVKWEITENSKEILGYNCQEALGDFRGRRYKAYFSKDIPFKNGPHKFDGLPGLILEVRSTDNVVSIVAEKIIFEESSITNPFIDSKYISWTEFLKKYNLYFDKVSNYRGEEGVTMAIAKRYLEVFIE